MKRQVKIGAMRAYIYLLLIAAALIPALAFVMALILSGIKNPGEMIGAASLATLLISALFTGAAAPKLRNEGWLITSVSAALTLAMVLAVLSVLCSDGENVGRGMLGAVCYFGIFMLSAVISSRPKKRKRRRR